MIKVSLLDMIIIKIKFITIIAIICINKSTRNEYAVNKNILYIIENYLLVHHILISTHLQLTIKDNV